MNRFREPLAQISIALCDDCEQNCSLIRNLLIRYQARQPQFDYVITTFRSMENLISERNNGTRFDILISGIYLVGINGIEGAKLLRYDGFDNPIIFFTASSEHAISAYSLNAAHYLLKPVSEKYFFDAMDKSIFSLNYNRKNHIVINVDREILKVKTERILYIETAGHYQRINLVDGTVLSPRIKASELFALLPENGAWLQISKAYIINLAFVDQLSSKSLCLANDEVLYLPRGSYKQVKDAYFQYYSKQGASSL